MVRGSQRKGSTGNEQQAYAVYVKLVIYTYRYALGEVDGGWC